MNIPGRGGFRAAGDISGASVDDMDFDELFRNESNGSSPQHPSTRARDEVSVSQGTPLRRRAVRLQVFFFFFSTPTASPAAFLFACSV